MKRMARPRSEDEPAAIFEAATEVVAMLGVEHTDREDCQGCQHDRRHAICLLTNKDELRH